MLPEGVTTDVDPEAAGWRRAHARRALEPEITVEAGDEQPAAAEPVAASDEG